MLERAIAETIANTGVKAGNPLVDNLRIINQAKNSEAEALKSSLQKSKTIVTSRDINNIKQNIMRSPLPFCWGVNLPIHNSTAT